MPYRLSKLIWTKFFALDDSQWIMTFKKQPGAGAIAHYQQVIQLIILMGLVILGGIIGYRALTKSTNDPDAIFVLGGSAQREEFAAQFAQEHPHLPIWISTGSPPDYAHQIFSTEHISLDRVHLDYQAVDTVTNFTTLVDDFAQLGIRHVYLITSDYHMRRAQTIGTIVFGSHGIEVTPIPVATNQPEEPIEKVVRDGGRSLLWLTTGRTGASLKKLLMTTQRPIPQSTISQHIILQRPASPRPTFPHPISQSPISQRNSRFSS